VLALLEERGYIHQIAGLVSSDKLDIAGDADTRKVTAMPWIDYYRGRK